jgi:Icc protein
MIKTGAQPPDGADTADGSPRPFRIIQLTDLHLYANAQDRLLGQNTRLTFESVLAVAMRRDWPPDALVLTGDLIHDERIEGYRFLRQRIE